MKSLWCYHGNETSSAVLSHGTISLVCYSNFWVCGWNPSGVTMETKPLQQFFHMVLFVLYVVLTFEPVAVSDPGCRGPGGPSSPLIFPPKWCPKGRKKHLWRLAPPYLRIWMTAPPPPLSEGLDPPLTVDETSPAALLHSSRFVCSSKSWACGWNSIVWPFKWNLAFSCTFTRCYLFSMWL